MKKLATAIALLATAGISSSVFAAQTTGNAQVNILSAITFNENQVVDFKYIPATDGTCTMAATGVLSGQCTGQPDGTPGQFTISGTPSLPVLVSVGSGSQSGGVTYNPTLVGPSSVSLNGSGSAVVNVVGNLVLSNATPGAKALTYVITVTYQ